MFIFFFVKETVSIDVRYDDKTIKYEVPRLKTVAEHFHELFIAQGLTNNNILMKYHGNDISIDLSTKLGNLKDSHLELIKIVKG